MELLQALIKKIIYLVPLIIIFGLLFLVLRFTFSALGLSGKIKDSLSSGAATSTKKTDILPPPGSWGSLTGKAPTPTDESTVPEFITPTFKEGVYGTSTGETIPSNQDEELLHAYDTPLYTDSDTYLRNIFIIKNMYLASGSTLIGEAEASFISTGKILIHLENEKGKTIMTTVAYAQKNPSTGGFIPWAARIGNVPLGSAPCTLVFENENYSGKKSLDIEVRVPSACK